MLKPAKDILVNSFGVPLATTAGAVTAEGVGAALTSGAQQVVDRALPTKGKLVAEATNKAAAIGNLTTFKRITNGIGVKDDGESINLTGAAASQVIAQVAPSARGQALPAALYREAPGPTRTNDLKVKLVNQLAGEVVLFEVMPSISEQHSAEYVDFSPVHHPGQIIKYQRTQARTWTISTKLISRTSQEAESNIRIINIVRSWVMPNYGRRAAGVMGAPPPVLTFTAYGRRMIGPIKCVLESYSWDFPTDVDYLPTKGGEPFPVVLNITLTLKESWSPAEFSGFSLMHYKAGRVSGKDGAFYRVPPRRQHQPQAAGAAARVTSAHSPVVGRMPTVGAANEVRRLNPSVPANHSGRLTLQERVAAGADVGAASSFGPDPGNIGTF